MLSRKHIVLIVTLFIAAMMVTPTLAQQRDTDGDGLPEEGATAWVYDSDHDGFVDKAEHIVNGRVRAIEPEGGVLSLGWVISPDPSKQPVPSQSHWNS